eukprot:7145379-Prymnesium_polylepis.1
MRAADPCAHRMHRPRRWLLWAAERAADGEIVSAAEVQVWRPRREKRPRMNEDEGSSSDVGRTRTRACTAARARPDVRTSRRAMSFFAFGRRRVSR